MLEFLTTLHWGAVFQIIVIDILLGGDNAVVIALACRNLPPVQRTKGVLWGTLGAILLRVALIAFAVALLDVPLLKFAGGLIINDPAGDRWPILDTPVAEYGMSIGCALFVVLAGYALKRRNANRVAGNTPPGTH